MNVKFFYVAYLDLSQCIGCDRILIAGNPAVIKKRYQSAAVAPLG